MKEVPLTIHKVCPNCQVDFYHNSTMDGNCGDCTIEGLSQLMSEGKVRPEWAMPKIKELEIEKRIYEIFKEFEYNPNSGNDKFIEETKQYLADWMGLTSSEADTQIEKVQEQIKKE